MTVQSRGLRRTGIFVAVFCLDLAVGLVHLVPQQSPSQISGSLGHRARSFRAHELFNLFVVVILFHQRYCIFHWRNCIEQIRSCR